MGCGNGGAKPRHATLFAESISEELCIQYLDRFLMYYILTADKLQRTAPWLEKLEGGIEHLREVIIDDKLGICEELERRMSFLVDTYECEWKAVVDDPERVKTFEQFVNTKDTEPGIQFITERNQRRPADWPGLGAYAPWKSKHVNIQVEPSADSAQVAQIEVSNEHGDNKYSWKLSWVDVGAVASFAPEGGSAIKHGNSQIAVFNLSGAWYATQNMCPHKRTIALSRGLVGDK